MSDNSRVLVGACAGVGLGMLMASMMKKQQSQAAGDVKASSDPFQGPASLSRSLSFVETDSDRKLAILEWENKQLRRELVVSQTQTHHAEHSYLSNADVERLKMMFHSFDDDNSGTIPIGALEKLCRKLGMPLHPEELAEAMMNADPNGSGKINLVDFLFWWTDMQKSSAFQLTSANLRNFDPTRLKLNHAGEQGSAEYRIYFEYVQDNGRLKQISPWHDIPLFSSEGICNFICEIPKWTRAKYEIAVDEIHNPIKQDTKNGQLRFYKHGDMMFNYGAFPQTWENPEHIPEDTGCIGDNDPIDAVEIGTQQLGTGSVTSVKPLGILALLDDGETDWKVVCININDPMAAQLNDIHDIETKFPGALDAIKIYFRTYKVCTGKPENKFGLGGRFKGADYAQARINECHEQWLELKASGKTTSNYSEAHGH